jgi:hypothetical protein
VGILSSLDDGLLGGDIVFAAAPSETFGHFENIPSSF